MRSATNTRKLVFGTVSVVFLLLAAVMVCSVAEAATTFTEVKKLTQASPTPGGPGWFGYDVDISGDTAIAGAREPFRFLPPGTVGSASIFERNLGGLNNWGERVKLVPPGSGDVGGVAIDGDTAVVGRDFENSRIGAAYIYGRNFGGPDNWGLVKRIEDPAGRQNCCDGFGTFVAISGDTIAVGEFWADRVHIFERNAGGLDNWGHVKVLTASDDGPFDFDFFSVVSIEGDTLVVGSANHTHAGKPDATGAIYVFERNEGGSNNWGLVKEIIASDALAGDQLGVRTALSGDTLIAGTSGNNVDAAYVFERKAGGPNNWGEVKKLAGGDVHPSESCFYDVGISGDVAVLMHCGHIHSSPLSFGTAFVFERNEGGSNNWGQTQELIPSDPGDSLFSVAIDCGTIIIGDISDNALFSDSGAVYVFEAPIPGGCNNKAIAVTIDIKPESDPNSINLGSGGTVPVAIFSTATFDARTVDPTTVTLAGAQVALKGKATLMSSVEDIDGDGLLDLVVHVRTEALQLSETDTEAVLEGKTSDGTAIRGTDFVRVVR